jgi:hypothetical protein
MSQIIQNVIKLIITGTLIYLLCSFVEANINYLNWHIATRAIGGLIWFYVSSRD